MVLQLTDFTSEITDEELREFTSEYYIPFALHPVVPAASASIADFPEGKVGVYTRFFEFANQRVPLSLFMCNILNYYCLHISQLHCIARQNKPISRFMRTYSAYHNNGLFVSALLFNLLVKTAWVSVFQARGRCIAIRKIRCAKALEGDVLLEMDLFSVVHLSKPKLVTEGVRPLRDGEEPLLESTAGRTMELVLEQPEVESTDVLAPTPLRSVPGVKVCWEEVDSGLKARGPTSGGLGGSTSTEEETPDAPPTLAAKEVTETPPPNVEATSDSSAPVPRRLRVCQWISLWGSLIWSLRSKPRWWRSWREGFLVTRSQSVQKDEEILLLKTQLADAQAEAESSRSYAQKLAEEKMALLVKVEQERANSADYKASCHWAVKYLEGGKNNHFAGLDEFRQRVEELLEKQEEKLRKLSIEYDEELYPHMLSAIAERRWLISHGLRLAAMSALESQEVKQSFGDVVKCALARGKAEAVEELHEKKLLTVPAAQVPGYNDNAYEELVAAMETMKLLELPHIAQLERDQDYPIDVIMAGLTLARHATEGAEAQPDYFLKPDVAQLQVPIFARPRDILNPFALEKEIPLKESLEAHAIRLAKKKGVKGKAILCGVGAAHIPRSDGVPVSVATVSPKDSEYSWGCSDPFIKVGLSPRYGISIPFRCKQGSGPALSTTPLVAMSIGEVMAGVPSPPTSCTLARWLRDWSVVTCIHLLSLIMSRTSRAMVRRIGTQVCRIEHIDRGHHSKFESLRRAAYSPGILLFMRERALAYEFDDRGHPRRILLFYHRRYLHLRDGFVLQDFDQHALNLPNGGNLSKPWNLRLGLVDGYVQPFELQCVVTTFRASYSALLFRGCGIQSAGSYSIGFRFFDEDIRQYRSFHASLSVSSTALIAPCVADKYIINSSPGRGATSVGSAAICCLSCVKASSASVVQRKSPFFVHFLSVLNKGSDLSADLDRNQSIDIRTSRLRPIALEALSTSRLVSEVHAHTQATIALFDHNGGVPVMVIDRGNLVMCFGSPCKRYRVSLQECAQAALPVSDSDPPDSILLAPG
ncbi:hypothetical protein Tco_1505776 [Tanacetum coccineum]